MFCTRRNEKWHHKGIKYIILFFIVIYFPKDVSTVVCVRRRRRHGMRSDVCQSNRISTRMRQIASMYVNLFFLKKRKINKQNVTCGERTLTREQQTFAAVVVVVVASLVGDFEHERSAGNPSSVLIDSL